MDFTADDLTANLMIWAAHTQTNGRQAPRGSPAFTCHGCEPAPQMSRGPDWPPHPPSGKHSCSRRLILADKQSRTSGHLLKRDKRGAMNGACLVQQCQTTSVNGVANRAPVRGAASSLPAPSSAPLSDTHQTQRHTKGVDKVSRCCVLEGDDYVISPCATCPVCH